MFDRIRQWFNNYFGLSESQDLNVRFPDKMEPWAVPVVELSTIEPALLTHDTNNMWHVESELPAIVDEEVKTPIAESTSTVKKKGASKKTTTKKATAKKASTKRKKNTK